MVADSGFWELHRAIGVEIEVQVQVEECLIRRNRRGEYDGGRGRRSEIEEFDEYERESVLWRQPLLVVAEVRSAEVTVTASGES